MNSTSSPVKPANSEKKPNDSNSLLFTDFVRISDPQTKEVLVQQRGGQ
tara:strand:- start:496 stop:639 length:144 start_codon:yes stop_codon:yes gene_type:complete